MAEKVTKVALKAKEAFEQYSKRMATRVTFFWMLYRIVISVLIFFNPSIATAMIHLTEGVDTVMIVNMSVYTGNSATEKLAIAFGKRDARYYSVEEKEIKMEEKDKEKDSESDDSDRSNG